VHAREKKRRGEEHKKRGARSPEDASPSSGPHPHRHAYGKSLKQEEAHLETLNSTRRNSEDVLVQQAGQAKDHHDFCCPVQPMIHRLKHIFEEKSLHISVVPAPEVGGSSGQVGPVHGVQSQAPQQPPACRTGRQA
jgi:hypothetical protein